LRSCTSPQFGSCLENFVIRPKVSGQTLRAARVPGAGHIDNDGVKFHRRWSTLGRCLPKRLRGPSERALLSLPDARHFAKRQPQEAFGDRA